MDGYGGYDRIVKISRMVKVVLIGWSGCHEWLR